MPDEYDFASFDSRLRPLERAQLLHDATLRRHGEMLDTHATAQAEMRLLLTRQQQMQADVLTLLAGHQERMDRLEALMQALKDLLDRGNGH